jgi:hypothetical protein
MFNEHQPDDPVRRFGQEDILGRSIRLGLAAAGPVGAIIGECLTECVPQQRVDRLHVFVERLAERMQGLEAEFSERNTTECTLRDPGRRSRARRGPQRQ